MPQEVKDLWPLLSSYAQSLGQPKATLPHFQTPLGVVAPPMVETNCIQSSGYQHPDVTVCLATAKKYSTLRAEQELITAAEMGREVQV